MPFQTIVRRNFPQGFPGEVVFSGPQRGRVARIAPNISNHPNRISRAFGFVGEEGTVGTTTSNSVYAANAPEVKVGGDNFFGILFNPKRYALYGVAANSLAPNLDLPVGSEGEFTNTVTGLVIELYNFGSVAQSVDYGWKLYYVNDGADPQDNPNGLEAGMIFALPEGAQVPDGTTEIPGIVTNPVTIEASAPGDLKGAVTIVQLNVN